MFTLKTITLGCLILLCACATNSNEDLSNDVYKGLVVMNTTFPYECPSEYYYLNHAYLTKQGSRNKQKGCAAIPTNTLVRLSTGGSMINKDGDCIIKTSDPNPASSVYCYKTGIHEITVDTKICKYKTTILSDEDGTHLVDLMCPYLPSPFDGRVGRFGHFLKLGKTCAYNQYGHEESNITICADAYVDETKIAEIKTETQCGEGKSLLTVDEVVANLKVLCKTAPTDRIVRLSGGASFVTGSKANEYKCGILPYDPSTLTGGLCANIARQ